MRRECATDMIAHWHGKLNGRLAPAPTRSDRSGSVTSSAAGLVRVILRARRMARPGGALGGPCSQNVLQERPLHELVAGDDRPLLQRLVATFGIGYEAAGLTHQDDPRGNIPRVEVVLPERRVCRFLSKVLGWLRETHR